MVMMEQKIILNYMPRRAKMRMKRKRRRRRETMDFMEASKETTRFRNDDQYLGNNKFQEEKLHDFFVALVKKEG